MDARSIAATAANKGFLTAATDMDVEYTGPTYHFDKTIYENRVLTVRELQTLNRRYSLVLISRTGHRW